MRSLLRPFLAAAFCAAALMSCTETQHPPAGRWQGAYEDGGLIVVARLEIAPSGVIRVSAPNAIADVAAMPEGDRAALRSKLLGELSQTWQKVEPLPLDFDGKDFRKPGGVAPQLEWDAKSHRMTMIYYSGNRASVRVPMDQVQQFDNATS